MGNVRQAGRHLTHLVRSRVRWLPSPENTESPLPYVARRPTVHPVLPVHDMDAAMSYYRSVGFAVVAYDAGYAWVRTCGWEMFHLVLAAGTAPGGSVAGAYLHVSDVDEWHRAIRTNAPDVPIGAITDTPWGMREFALTDPSGNVVRIGRPR